MPVPWNVPLRRSWQPPPCCRVRVRHLAWAPLLCHRPLIGHLPSRARALPSPHRLAQQPRRRPDLDEVRGGVLVDGDHGGEDHGRSGLWWRRRTARRTRRGSYRGDRVLQTGGVRVAPPASGCGSTVARTLFLVLAITYLPLPSTSRSAAPPARLEVSPDMDRTDPGGAFQHPRRPRRE
jgi:hypothetical protein